MNIIAVSYTNIGPFRDRTVSVVVQSGSCMIVAPVGTGKSMLFFDGIVYGLYKYSTRDVLNIGSTQGTICVLFEIHGDFWLVQRQIQRGKRSKNISTTSRLGRWNGSLDSFYEQYSQVIYADVDVLSALNVEFEVFKNESDLQNTIELLLPQRDVFVNRDMMMQESSNVFDLTQTQRIDVFKHLFGLLDIDIAKDRLAEEKTKIKYILQTKRDLGHLTVKVQQYVVRAQQLWDVLISSGYAPLLGVDFGGRGESVFLMNTMLSLDQIPLIDGLTADIFFDTIQAKKSEFLVLQQQMIQQRTVLDKQHNTLQELQHKIRIIVAQKETLQKSLLSYNPEELQQLKKQRSDISSQINDIEFGLHYDVYPDDINEFSVAHKYVMDMVQEGKHLGEKLNTLQVQQQSYKDKQALEQKHHLDRLHQFDTQIKDIKGLLDDKQNKLAIATTFFCKKIDANCPFIDQIAEGIVKQYDAETNLLQERLQSMQHDRMKLEQVPQHDYVLQITALEQQIQQTTQQIKALKKLVVTLGYSYISQQYDTYQKLIKMASVVEQKITQVEQLASQYDDTDKQLLILQGQESELLITQQSLQEEIQQGESGYIDIAHMVQEREIGYSQLVTWEQSGREFIDLISRINDVLYDYKTIQQEIVALETRLRYVDDLYMIVSKELTVLVLQQYLPILSDIINNQLSKVEVGYQIDFVVNAGGDKLEIMIKDGQEDRDVKSLSGGQRAILRLCWILSIALRSGNKFLFLDETINHLDTNMIAGAASLLEDFVEDNRVTLYCITHSEQIQDLQIWDRVVRLKDIL